MRRSEVESLKTQLSRFIPIESSVPIAELIVDYNVKLTITKRRLTKLGDYRHPHGKIAYHRISVNGDLNQFMFLLVLLHEFAHLFMWEKHKRSVKAHGEEWKDAYRKLYLDFSSYFPENVRLIIDEHFKKLKATTCHDEFLTRHLMHMDKEEGVQLLTDLSPGDLFESNGRRFHMINKRRTRFLCEELGSKKKYLVSGSAVVIRLNE